MNFQAFKQKTNESIGKFKALSRKKQITIISVAGAIVLALILVLSFTCCNGKNSSHDMSSPGISQSSNKRLISEVISDSHSIVLELIRKQPGFTYTKSGELSIVKVRESPNDPDTYYAKVVIKSKFKTGMFDIQIEYAGGMIEVTLLE